MGNSYFYEQPVIQEGNQTYRFGCQAFEIGTFNFKDCVINEQSYESLWYYSYSYMYIFEKSFRVFKYEPTLLLAQ